MSAPMGVTRWVRRIPGERKRQGLPFCELPAPHTGKRHKCEPVRIQTIDGVVGWFWDLDEDRWLDIQNRDVDESTPVTNGQCAIAQCILRSDRAVAAQVGRVVYALHRNGTGWRGILSDQANSQRRTYDEYSKKLDEKIFAPGPLLIKAPQKTGDRLGHQPEERQGSNKREGKATNMFSKPPTRAIVRPT